MTCYTRVLQSARPTDHVNTISLSSKARGYILLSHRCSLRPSPSHRQAGIHSSLQTTDKRVAVVNALNLAATAKQLFINLQRDMSNTDPEKLRQLLEVAIHKNRLTIEREERAEQIDQMERQHAEQLKKVRLQAENDALNRALASFSASGGGSSCGNSNSDSRNRHMVFLDYRRN